MSDSEESVASQQETDEQAANVTESNDSHGQRDKKDQASKFDLAKIFCWQDNVPTLLDNGQFDEAFGVLDERNTMGMDLRNARSLLNYAVCLMATEHDYDAIEEQLKSIIAAANPTSKAVLWLVKKLRKQEKCFSALVIDKLCLDIFFDDKSPYETFGITEDIISSMRQTVTGMIETDESVGAFIQRNILPKMYYMKEMLMELENIDPYYQSAKSGYVAHCIEVCETNNDARIRIILDTIDYMRRTMGDKKVKKHQIYGTLCNNLGSTYLKMGSRENAIEYYKETLECFKLATDFENDDKRDRYIRDVNMALLRAQGEEEEIGIGFGRM